MSIVTIEELVAEKGEMEIAMLAAVNEIKKAFEAKTGAVVYEISFPSIIVLEYNMKFATHLFTDCESKIAYKGVKIEEMK